MSITQNFTHPRRVNEATLLQLINGVVGVPELLRYPPRSPVATGVAPRPQPWGRVSGAAALAGILVVLGMISLNLFRTPTAPPASAHLVPAPIAPPVTVPSSPPPTLPDPTTRPVPVAATEDATHITMLPNEALADVARRAGVSVEALIAANNLRQPDGTLRPIYAGEVLIRPPADAVSVAAAPAAPPAAPPAGDRTHQVQSGETLNQIAGQFGVTVEALVGRNNLADANTIYAGQTLLIPDASYTPPAWAYTRVAVAAAPPSVPPAGSALAPPPAADAPPTATPVPLRIAAMPAAAGGGSDQSTEPAPTLPPAPPTPCPTYVVSGEQWYARQSLSPGQWALIRPDLIDVVLSTCGDTHQEIRKPNLPTPTPPPTSPPMTQATVPPGGIDLVIQEPLYRIAVRYGWTVDDLVQANPGLDPTQNNQGRTIHVPAH